MKPKLRSLLAALLVVGAGAAVVGAPSDATAAASGARADTPGALGAPSPGSIVKGKSTGKGTVLTPRLAALADPAVAGLSPTLRARRLSVPEAGAGALVQRGGRVLVEVRVSDTTAATVARVTVPGSLVVRVDSRMRVITLEVPPAQLPALAAVQPQVKAVTEVLAPVKRATCPTGIQSEGDAQLTAAAARAAAGVDGTGITVGIISDSYNIRGGAPNDVSNAELPGTGNPCGYPNPVSVQTEGVTGNGDEGRAMAQIVHDLAPGATLRFASGMNGPSDMAAQIRGLASAGAKVIVDDVAYFDEPNYQDGVIAAAVADVLRQGVSYFSAAGNENVIDPVSGKPVGSYEAMSFRPMSCPASVAGFYTVPVTCQSFSPGDNTLGLSVNGSLTYKLGWNEPAGGITTDLDLFALDANGNIIAHSTEDNTVTQRAFESVSAATSGPVSLVVANVGTGLPRLKLTSIGSQISGVEHATPYGSDVYGPTLFGHAATPGAGAAAAIPFDNANAIEWFSSPGPAEWCWGSVAGPTPAPRVTPCRTSTVGLSGTDGTSNSFFGSYVSGVWRFYGTSAAAPHAAAVAALLRQYKPCMTPAQVLAVMTSTAQPVGSAGRDSSGSGRVDAEGGVNGLSVAPCGPPGTPGTFTPVTPKRVLDTRVGTGGPPGGLRAAGSLTFRVPGLPADATAVTLNVTATGPTSATFVTVHPGGQPTPGTSNLNVLAGQTIPNQVIVPVGPAGSVTIYNDNGLVDLVADLAGYYSASGPAGLTALSPSRVLDTRNGTGAPLARVPANGSLTLTLPSSVPAGTTAVVLNVTVVNPGAAGYLTAYPAGQPMPLASNLNFVAGQTIPNLVTVAVSPDRKVTFTSANSDLDLVADLTGYFAPNSGSALTTTGPTRVLDTRSGVGAPAARVGPGGKVRLTVPGIPQGTTAVVLNVTAVQASASSYLTVFPSGAVTPYVSNLNYGPGQTIPNLVTVKVGPGGTVDLLNAAGTVDLVADLEGWYSG